MKYLTILCLLLLLAACDSTSSSAANTEHPSVTEETNGEQQWTVSFREGNNVGSSSSKVKSDLTQGRLVQPMNEITLSSEPEPIALIIMGNGSRAFSSENQAEDAIAANREVYVLRCQIS